MTWLFASGHAADIVILVVVLEFVCLVAMGRWRAGALALRLSPAVLMMLGMRGALTGSAWPWIALPLALSFPIHVLDLRRR